MSEQAQKQYEDLTKVEKVITVDEASTTEVVNIPLTSDQKLALTNLRLRRSTIQRQIAELQTQEAKIEGFFHGELTKIAIANKIDINAFVLDDNLDIKPMSQNPKQLRA